MLQPQDLLVHGAIGGMFGQVGSYPGDIPLWDNDDVPDKGVETKTGNPPFTPALWLPLRSPRHKVPDWIRKGLKGVYLVRSGGDESEDRNMPGLSRKEHGGKTLPTSRKLERRR